MPAEYIPCVDKDSRDLTRMQFAKLVALRVHNLITIGKDRKSFVCIFASLAGMGKKLTCKIRNGDVKSLMRRHRRGI
jgi:hypothetical protein